MYHAWQGMPLYLYRWKGRVRKRRLSEGTVRTVMPGNGPEFAEFREIERDMEANENTDGLPGFYFPEGTDFRAVADERVREAVDLPGRRPRKCPGWLFPEEFSFKCCA